VEHEVEVLIGDPSKRGEVSSLVVIAAADGKPQAIDRGARGRRFWFARSTDRRRREPVQ
jgi:hypothetical protein